MKKTRIIGLGCTTALALGLMANSAGVAEHQGKDRTGAPGSQPACTECHNGGTFSPQPSLMLTDLEETTDFMFYLPGQTMRLTFTVNASNSPAGFGLQATALLADNSNAGTFSNPSANAQLENVGGRHIVEHNDLSASNTFTVDWTAPPAGSGEVTVYYASLAANGNGGTAGDSYAGGSMTFGEGASTAICGPDCRAEDDAPVVRAGALEWTSNTVEHLQAFSVNGQLLGTWTLQPGFNRLDIAKVPSGLVIFATEGGRVARIWNP